MRISIWPNEVAGAYLFSYENAELNELSHLHNSEHLFQVREEPNLDLRTSNLAKACSK
jgi:hypothetical protein